jgi:lipopolysaccharide transport system ATP-binding protein
MSDTVIKVNKLSKAYRIGLKEQKNDTLGGAAMTWLKSPMKNFRRLKNLSAIHSESAEEDIFWALKDISFEVNKGDILGVIGKNGAGKSTLLKILSKITDPTGGDITITGRVASLLEVGTGFNPDLTGRENTYLNGTILGMTKKEIDRKFDEIVEFSGVEKFIDTPVKRYSSGMKVRLGFAVAAHLDPEILIVDEVLAVGDFEFQKKCLGKMHDISAGQGRTVLFVSHNMNAIKQLCNRCIVLKNGVKIFDGPETEAVNFYQENQQGGNSNFTHEGPVQKAPGNENIRVLGFDVKPLQGENLTIYSGLEFSVKFINYKPNINLDVNFELRSTDDLILFNQSHIVSSNYDSKIGIYTIKGIIQPHLLNAGVYFFKVGFGENLRYSLFKVPDIVQFELQNISDVPPYGVRVGVIIPDIKYSLTLESI